MAHHHSGKFFLTAEGLERFKKEYKKLLRVRNSKASDQNGLLEINQRVEDLELILKGCKLIKPPPKTKQHIVALGATVIVEVDSRIDEFAIVGTLEANPSLGKISNESPVGKLLLGRKVGDEIIIQSGTKTIYKIKEIKYEIK